MDGCLYYICPWACLGLANQDDQIALISSRELHSMRCPSDVGFADDTTAGLALLLTAPMPPRLCLSVLGAPKSFFGNRDTLPALLACQIALFRLLAYPVYDCPWFASEQLMRGAWRRSFSPRIRYMRVRGEGGGVVAMATIVTF